VAQRKIQRKFGIPASIDQKKNPFLEKAELIDCVGFQYGESESLVKSNGLSLQPRVNSSFIFPPGPATISGERIAGIFEQSSDGGVTRAVVAVTLQGLYQRLSNAVWSPTTHTGPTFSAMSGLGVKWAQMGGVGYVATEFNRVMEFHPSGGAMVSNFSGILAPGAPSVLSQVGGTLPLGQYKYAYSYVYQPAVGPEQESNMSPTTDAVSVGTIRQFLVNVVDPVAGLSAKATKVRIYRTLVNGVIPLFLTELTLPTASFLDNLPDSGLGVAGEVSANGMPPDKVTVIYAFDNRMWYVPRNSSRIYFSKIGNPGAVHANDFLDLSPDDNERLEDICELNGMLIAGKANSIWVLTGTTRDTYRFVRRETGVGPVSRNSFIAIPGESLLMFPSRRGIEAFNGVESIYVSTKLEPYYHPLTLQSLSVSHTIVALRQNSILFFLPGSGAGTLLGWDYVNKSWWRRELPVDFSFFAAHVLVGARSEVAVGNNAALTRIRFLGETYYDSTVQTVITGAPIDASPTALNSFLIEGPVGKGNELKTFTKLIIFFKRAVATVTVSLFLDKPDATAIPLGTLSLDNEQGWARFNFNFNATRIYYKIQHTGLDAAGAVENVQVVLRGTEVWYDEWESGGQK
jgi:hypothetical protein